MGDAHPAASLGSGRVKGVIFDLDGTLADTLESIAYCGNYAMRSCKLPDIPLEKYRYFVGEGADTLIRRCLIYSGDEDLKLYEKAYAKYQIIFKEECLFNVTVYPGMLETLQELKANGIRLAVLSNKPQERTLDVVYSLFGRDLFDTVLGHRQGIAKKPSPQGVQEILNGWDMEAKDVLFVGDSATDMITGNAAGATTVGVLWGFRDRAELEKHRAQKIIERPEELLELL
ncbi:MAG: HAD family hydrolase [Lachnospiraceae bacterium]|nr:HAD family hydrolase [Lachnospiraceae bacterium]